jgi:hypothetical protein
MREGTRVSVLEIQAIVGADPDGVLVAADGEIDLETATARLTDWLNEAFASGREEGGARPQARCPSWTRRAVTALLVAHNEAEKIGIPLVLRSPTRRPDCS